MIGVLCACVCVRASALAIVGRSFGNNNTVTKSYWSLQGSPRLRQTDRQTGNPLESHVTEHTYARTHTYTQVTLYARRGVSWPSTFFLTVHTHTRYNIYSPSFFLGCRQSLLETHVRTPKIYIYYYYCGAGILLLNAS